MRVAGYLQLEQEIGAWCRERADILAALVIGSRGRTSPPADDFSDLDLILFTTDPDIYADDSSWMNVLGDAWIAAKNQIGQGDPEWLVLFDGGSKADFLFVAAARNQSLDEMLRMLPYQDVLARGARILYESDSASVTSPIAPVPAAKPFPPSNERLTQEVNKALFAVERLVKFALRGDRWRSQYEAGVELRGHLLTLVEWHARTEFGPSLDTWYGGRYMDAWADKRVLEAIRPVEFDPAPSNLEKAISMQLELIEWLAKEIAAHLDYPMIDDGQQEAIAWIKKMSRDDRHRTL